MAKAAEQYHGKTDVLRTWELRTTTDEQFRNSDYLRGLRHRVRVARQRAIYATRNTPLRNTEKRDLLDGIEDE